MNLYKMPLMSTFVALTILTIPSAHALVSRTDSRCVSRTVEEIHNHLVNYANYKNIDGRSEANLRYQMEVAMPAPFDNFNMRIPLINMTSSEPTFKQPLHSTRNTDAIIWIVLQPYTLNRPTDRPLLPRFYIHCRSSWASNETSFHHTCEWIPPPYGTANNTQPHSLITEFLPGVSLDPLFTSFGVGGRDGLPHTGFQSELTVDTNGCAPGQSHMQYTFSIEPNALDIQEVKPTVIRRFVALLLNRVNQIPGIGSLLTSGITPIATTAAENQIAPLFDENNQNNFYGWYYTEFYNAWANSIPSSSATQ